jgi:hypothetical protein
MSDPHTISRAYVAAQTDSRPRAYALQPRRSSWWLVALGALIVLVARYAM